MPPDDSSADPVSGTNPLVEVADAARLGLWIDVLADAIDASADERSIVLIGIPRRGVPLAERLARSLRERHARACEVERLDPTLWRDDFDAGSHDVEAVGSPPTAAVAGRHIVLVDDVMWTGRTARAALDHLMTLGRPALVELAVLVDRGGREVPLQPTHTAHHETVPIGATVEVRFEEIDGDDGVYVRATGRREA